MQKLISDVSSTRCTESILSREFYLTAPDPISIFLFSHLHNGDYLYCYAKV